MLSRPKSAEDQDEDPDGAPERDRGSESEAQAEHRIWIRSEDRIHADQPHPVADRK
jgi:hypothetical protein